MSLTGNQDLLSCLSRPHGASLTPASTRFSGVTRTSCGSEADWRKVTQPGSFTYVPTITRQPELQISISDSLVLSLLMPSPRTHSGTTAAGSHVLELDPRRLGLGLGSGSVPELGNLIQTRVMTSALSSAAAGEVCHEGHGGALQRGLHRDQEKSAAALPQQALRAPRPVPQSAPPSLPHRPGGSFSLDGSLKTRFTCARLAFLRQELQSHRKQGPGFLSRVGETVRAVASSVRGLKSRPEEFTLMHDYLEELGSKINSVDKISLRISKEQRGTDCSSSSCLLLPPAAGWIAKIANRLDTNGGTEQLGV